MFRNLLASGKIGSYVFKRHLNVEKTFNCSENSWRLNSSFFRLFFAAENIFNVNNYDKHTYSFSIFLEYFRSVNYLVKLLWKCIFGQASEKNKVKLVFIIIYAALMS